MRKEIVRSLEYKPDGTPSDLLQKMVSEGARLRNASLDWLFYDVGALTPEERSLLLAEDNAEGAIIVVHPRDARGAVSLQKFDTYEDLCSAPGRKLSSFVVSGVGSSDVGAAALARNVADHTGQPVGAVVAGYGMADLVSEAMGGWFFFGTVNATLNRLHRNATAHTEKTEAVAATLTAMRGGRLSPEELATASQVSAGFSPDTMTVLRLLTEPERRVDLLVGHSKGCLSIAFALEALAWLKDADAIGKARAARVLTLGAVVEFPDGYDNVVQVIGSLDGFGGLNSRPFKRADFVPGAWHHLNARLPFHLDVSSVLARHL